MSKDHAPQPISIHIPASLSHLAIPLETFLKENPKYHMLAVGAFIFTSPDQKPPRFLLVQRAATELSFPNLWEVPGGSSEFSDPTVLHSVAREVFEETGLHLTRFIRQIGKGIEFINSRKKQCLKLSFEIQVAELSKTREELVKDMELTSTAVASTVDNAASPTDFIPITLDPEEHQNYTWVTEDELKKHTLTTGPYPLVTEDQRQMFLQAFALHCPHCT